MTGAADFDWSGFLWTGLASFALMYSLESVARNGDWRIAGPLLAISAAAGVYAVRHARRSPHPLLDLSPFRLPSFAITVAGGVLFRAAISAAPFLLPLMFQLGLRPRRLHSGLLTFASAAGAMTMKTRRQHDHPHLRLSRGDVRQRGDQRRVSVRLRVFPALDAACGDLPGAARRRVFPLAADDEHQLALLRRRAAGNAEPRHQPDQHVPAIVASGGVATGALLLFIFLAMRGGAPTPLDFSFALCRGGAASACCRCRSSSRCRPTPGPRSAAAPQCGEAGG